MKPPIKVKKDEDFGRIEYYIESADGLWFSGDEIRDADANQVPPEQAKEILTHIADALNKEIKNETT